MSTILQKTQSLCPVCLSVVPARYEEENGAVWFHKECPEHGSSRVLFWRDAELYKRWGQKAVHAAKLSGVSREDKGCPYDCGLCAEHEGKACTCVLEVTYRCNMGCAVCFADTEKARFDPSLETIERMYRTAWKNGGDCSIQISGGEPTVRDDLPDILRLGKILGFSHIQVNTNGLRLAREPEYAKELAKAGADLVYLQFDGTKDTIYNTIRRQPLLQTKKQAIENCEKANLGVLLVPTIIPGVNLDNVGEIVHFAKDHMPTVRGIHFQPVSYFGRFPEDVPDDDGRAGLCDVMHALETQTKGEIALRHFNPRARYDSHCAFSSLFYLPEQGPLQAITEEEQADILDENTDFSKRANKFTNAHWRLSADKGEKPIHGNEAMRAFRERLSKYTLAITGMGFQDVWNIDIGRLKGCCVSVISDKEQAVPLCAFPVPSVSGERLYENG